MSQSVIDILILIAIVVVALFAIGMVFARLYRRSSKEVSFVRTGFGGQKVIMNGGALVFPVLHEQIPVNMNTLRLEVRRANEQALITKDRMRVDVIAEFYVRVTAEASAVAAAAQTLGQRTLEPEQLKELVEGKFVDALRTAAAEMTMEELHDRRGHYVKRVREAVAGDLTKNGLELESASLTQLDQTAMLDRRAADHNGLDLVRRDQGLGIAEQLGIEIADDHLSPLRPGVVDAHQPGGRRRRQTARVRPRMRRVPDPENCHTDGFRRGHTAHCGLTHSAPHSVRSIVRPVWMLSGAPSAVRRAW